MHIAWYIERGHRTSRRDHALPWCGSRDQKIIVTCSARSRYAFSLEFSVAPSVLIRYFPAHCVWRKEEDYQMSNDDCLDVMMHRFSLARVRDVDKKLQIVKSRGDWALDVCA